MLHRVRDQPSGQRTASISALRGRLAEFGIVAAQRQAGLRDLRPVLGEVEDERIPPLARQVLQPSVAQIRELEAKIAGLDRRLVAMTCTDPICRSRLDVPGIGRRLPLRRRDRARCDGFPLGRHLAAWLGLVPGQQTTRGKPDRSA